MDQDVSVFLQHNFGIIRRERDFVADWPGQTHKVRLCAASGRFIQCLFFSYKGFTDASPRAQEVAQMYIIHPTYIPSNIRVVSPLARRNSNDLISPCAALLSSLKRPTSS
jgi:hypothetical protein